MPIAGIAGMKNVALPSAPEMGAPLASVSFRRKTLPPLWAESDRNFYRSERTESQRANCHVRELSHRLRESAAGRTRFFRSTSPRRERGFRFKCSAGKCGTLGDKGNGLYEGSGQLENGGTWQVAILAKKNGQLIATKQLSVNAKWGPFRQNSDAGADVYSKRSQMPPYLVARTISLS
jgi:hypothetical protein